MDSDYLTYRGKCKEMAEAAAAEDATLTVVRGYYLCPIWGEQAHWWTVRQDGTIHDPAEFRPLRRDSLCPSGASLVSTMPAPSGDNGGAIR